MREMTEMPEFEVEALPREAAPAQATPVPLQPAPANAAAGPAAAAKITNIAQLPSIWTLKGETEWLIDGLIPLSSVNLITAESGTGKTWVACA
jgi:hypothetical protein